MRKREIISPSSLIIATTARDECEGGNQEEEKFCMFHIAYVFYYMGAVSARRLTTALTRENL